tara:strand:+ start:851 stop:997 length:147 start_codon:yes stop_codon:yes gene_type:complete
MMVWLLFRLGDAEVVAPTVPGLEYTIDGEPLHYTMPVNRLHYTLKDED